MNDVYERTQQAWYPFAILGVIVAMVVLTTILAGATTELVWFWAVFLVMMVVILGVFSRLTVTVDHDEVSARFGWGWPKRRIPIPTIAGIEQVRNSGWYGWGVRYIPGGTCMYNVSGLDAVEISMTDGSKFRIGTDDPEGLKAAVDAAAGGLPGVHA